MGVIDSAVLRGDLGDFDHLFRSGVAAGSVVQAGGDADGSAIHGLGDEGLHLLKLRGGGRGVGHLHDLAADSSLADEERGVGADALLLPLGERGGDVNGAVSVVAGDDGGDALGEVGLVVGAFGVGEVGGGVRVRVDEAGRDDEPGGVDGATGGARDVGLDEDDAVAEDADVGVDGGRAGAVQDRAVADEEVELLGVKECRGEENGSESQAKSIQICSSSVDRITLSSRGKNIVELYRARYLPLARSLADDCRR